METMQYNRKLQLSDHFTYHRLIRFTMPSVIMMVFASIYGLVDGYFISNYVGKTAFTSVNLIIPYVQIIGGLGVILGADGGILIARTLGAGDRERSGRYFSMTMLVALFGGLLFTAVGLIALRPVAYYLGATEEMIEDCVIYGRICILFTTAQLMQNILQGYLIVAEKPKFALRVMVLAAITNAVLDFFFIHEDFLNMGVAGAAWATGISQIVAAVVPIAWFVSRRNTTALRFRKARIDTGALRIASYTGTAEMVSTLAASIIGLLYNIQLMKYAGPDGVTAYGVIMYVSFVFMGVFAGYGHGSSPIMGYHFGAGNYREMRSIFRKSVVILGLTTFSLFGISLIFARPLSALFVGYDWKLLDLTVQTFTACIIPFLIMWFNMYLANVLSSIGKGAMSAWLTTLRVIVLPAICLFVLPQIWGLEGVWYALTIAELISMIIFFVCFLSQKRSFGY